MASVRNARRRLVAALTAFFRPEVAWGWCPCPDPLPTAAMRGDGVWCADCGRPVNIVGALEQALGR